MVRPERQMTQTLKVAGCLATAMLALALLISCAGRPLATPTAPSVVPSATPLPPPASPIPGAGRGRLTAADGYLADDEELSPFATDFPAVGNLAPELRAAVQRASTDAA